MLLRNRLDAPMSNPTMTVKAMPPDASVQRLLGYVWEWRQADHYREFIEGVLHIPIPLVLGALQDISPDENDDWILINDGLPSHISAAAFFETIDRDRCEGGLAKGSLSHISLFLSDPPDLEKMKGRLHEAGCDFLGVMPTIYLQGPKCVTYEITTSAIDVGKLSDAALRARSKLKAWNNQTRAWRGLPL